MSREYLNKSFGLLLESAEDLHSNLLDEVDMEAIYTMIRLSIQSFTEYYGKQYIPNWKTIHRSLSLEKSFHILLSQVTLEINLREELFNHFNDFNSSNEVPWIPPSQIKNEIDFLHLVFQKFENSTPPVLNQNKIGTFSTNSLFTY